MKTKILLSVLAFTLLTMNAYSQSSNWDNSVENNEIGKPAVVTSYSGKIPTQKTIYQYNEDGNRSVKELYAWHKNQWQPVFKLEYMYKDGDQLSMCSHAKWDKKAKDWSAKIQNMIYIYDNEGDLLTIKYSESRDDFYNRLTQK